MRRHLHKALIVLFLLIVIAYVAQRYSISGELPYPTVHNNGPDTTLTIGIIGDSWTYGNQLDPHIRFGLLKRGIHANIVSASHPGARSRHLYHDLHGKDRKHHHVRKILEPCPDFCVVVIGVNDAASQIGSKNYAVHMTYIVKTLLHHGAHPVLVSLPEFGIDESIRKMGFLREYRNKLAALVNNRGEIDNIRTYRKALLKELKKAGLDNRVTWIDFDKVCPDYHHNPEFYRDPMHLSVSGTEKFADVISEELSVYLKSNI